MIIVKAVIYNHCQGKLTGIENIEWSESGVFVRHHVEYATANLIIELLAQA